MTSDETAIFVLQNNVEEISKTDSCLSRYFNKVLDKSKLNLPGELAIVDSKKFQLDVLNITDRLNIFLDSKDHEVAYLVLGKIQSGKTANLLGTLAWASDAPVALATIFTGVTEALNSQTIDRLKVDLADLGEQYISVHQVPTSTNGFAYENLYKEVSKWVERRLEIGFTSSFERPLPILVTLKNPSRVKTLKILMNSLQEKFGKGLVLLLIDDEADQASQNAGARKREVTATYNAIKDLRDLQSRNIMLSYTATPQAVLLTERNGRIRPNFCVTVKPRTGYFGLEQVVSKDFTNHLITVGDLGDEGKKPSTWPSSPKSLRNAIIQFVWTGWIQTHQKNVFYRLSGLQDEQLGKELKSVQMLIHESGTILQHTEMFRHVKNEIERLGEGLKDALIGNLTEIQIEDLENEWLSILKRMTQDLPQDSISKLDIRLSQELIKQLFALIDHSKTLVVNSDPNRPSGDLKLPITSKDWESARLWFLIGGDILGRGLTIPQLTVSYFLRHPKSPNFDTVSQQMRFCGYRNNYKEFIYLHAQQKTFDLFMYMNEIDKTVWNRAIVWDEQLLDIYTNLPSVLYASRTGVKLDPVRRSVRDPDLIDRKVKETIFSLKTIFDPNDFRQNISQLKTFFDETKISGTSVNSWVNFSDLSNIHFQRLISMWSTPDSRESALLLGTAELFDEEMGELGLADVPKNIFVKSNILDSGIDISDNLHDFIESVEATRGHSSITSQHNLKNWELNFTQGIRSIKRTSAWPSLAVPHLGDSQRKLRDDLDEIATILIIEPVLACSITNDRRSAKALGCAFTLLSPTGFELRMIGHR